MTFCVLYLVLYFYRISFILFSLCAHPLFARSPGNVLAKMNSRQKEKEKTDSKNRQRELRVIRFWSVPVADKRGRFSYDSTIIHKDLEGKERINIT